MRYPLSYVLEVTGTGSIDGSRAVISISIQNTGYKPLLVQGVWISPGGAGTPQSATVAIVEPTSIPTSAVIYSSTPPSRPTGGKLVIRPETSAIITMVLLNRDIGHGFYTGTPLIVTVYAVDRTNAALTNDHNMRITT